VTFKDGVKRAETLRRVAELRQRQARAYLAGCMQEVDYASRRVALGDRLVESRRAIVADSAGGLIDRQARVLAAAQARSDLVKAHAAAVLALAAAREDVVVAAVELRGRERLKARRVSAWLDFLGTVEQKMLDDIRTTEDTR